MSMFHGGFWNDRDNYVEYKVSELIIHQEMSYAKLLKDIMEQLGLVGSSDYPDIFSCIGTTQFMKDMKISDDKDVHWLYNVIFNGVAQCCSLVVDCRNCLSNVLDRMPINTSSSIDNGIPSIGQFHYSIDVTNILRNFHIEVNDKFCGKKNLQNALRSVAIRDNFQFRTIKSNRDVLIVRFFMDNCQWYLHASKFGDQGSEIWIVKKFVQEHTCSLEIVLNDHRQATFSVIKEFIKDRTNMFGTDLLSVKDVISHVRRGLGISINYQKAWRVRKSAIKEIKGSPEESYALVPSFCHMIKVKNPGSVCDFKVDNHGRFHYLFMALSSSIDGYQYCRPLKPCIGPRQDLVTVFDRHKSIVKSAEKVFTTACHCICAFYCTRHSEELSGIGFSKWSYAYSPSSRYNFMTTNISKSLNAAMKDAMELPITSMLEVVRMMLQRWFYKRQNDVDFQITKFTKSAESKLSEQISACRTMKVYAVNNDIYQKHLPKKGYVSSYYSNNYLSSTYSGSIHPLGHQSSWNIPEDVKIIKMLLPNVKRPAGRPKKLRIPSALEFKKRVKCSRCGRYGHNRKSCKFSLTQ
ncbi:uncharacterized protein LOC111022347 [Momordica charantia]|uniref:Uncharacterized protein LOC111022347 n=1 Tax=Momordica charantia TaxID=3673 RepID=A0A6J1DNQ8_MOMCH|nr:uncharacterized protein LOC111022347 [Momordica charantia]